MSISSKNTDLPKGLSFYTDELNTGGSEKKNNINADVQTKANDFAQWPDSERDSEIAAPSHNPRANATGADATLNLPEALYRNRSRRESAPRQRSTLPAETINPLIEAYRAATVNATHLNGRLEDDDALMGRLAKASGLYADMPTAAKLTSGQRRQLTTDLIRAFTQGIDWKAALGPDPDRPDAIYYDGLVLRNASDKPLTKVAQDLEARIGKVLRARGMADVAGIGNSAGLARQIRRTMTSDPTISLQPPPDVAYGGPRWLALWTGMQTLTEQGLDPGKHDADALIHAGRAAISTRAAEAPTTSGTATVSGTTAAPGVDMGGLLLMAHAAGKLDLLGIAKGEATISVDGLTAYYKEVFADDLRLLDTLTDLARLTPPTGKQLATDNLRAAGIDPDHLVDMNKLVIPAAFGPVRITIPLPVSLYRQSIADSYVSLEKLDLEALPASPGDGSTAPTAIPDKVAQARAKLTSSLKDEFDIAFDKYRASVAEHVAQIIDVSISRYAKQHGIDVSNASITVSRVQRQISLGKIGLGKNWEYEFAPQSIKLDERDSDGYFISIYTPTSRYTYFRPLAPGGEFTLPQNFDIDDWARDHGKIVFGASRDSSERTILELILDILFHHAYPIKKLASGRREEIADRIKTAVPPTLERQRADAYGSSIIEQLRNLERNLLPFYSTYSAIRDGRTEDIATSAQLDALMFIPGIGEELSLGLRAGEALAAGFKRAAASYAARQGLLQAFKMGTIETGAHLPALGSQAGKVLWNLSHQVIINPMDILTLLHGGARLSAKSVRAVIDRLKAIRPMLAKELSEAAGANHAIVDGHWMVRGINDTPKSKTAATNLSGEPLYLTATSKGGGRLPLRRYGRNGYTTYNPQTLAPEGYLLIPDAQGRLYRSLPIEVLERYGVSDATLRKTLAAAARSGDGTIMLGAKRYAEINGDYLELVTDHASTTSGKPIWRLAGAPLPGTPDGAPRLAWNARLRMWREPDIIPALNGGGSSPRNAFREHLISRIRGGATEQQLQRFRQTLTKLEGEPRANAILRAMQAQHELLGETPEIVLFTTDRTRPRPMLDGPAQGYVWYLDLDELDAASPDDAWRELAGVYEDMTGSRQGGDPYAALLARDEPPLDSALEQSWEAWLAANDTPGHRAAIDKLRWQLREARCYGGMNKKTLWNLLRHGEFDEMSFGLKIELVDAELKAVPPMPDDVSILRIPRNPITDWSNLPRGLKVLDAAQTGGAGVLEHLPPDLIWLNVAGNELERLPGNFAFPRGLKQLYAHNNKLSELSALPDTVELLDLRDNRFANMPGNLSGKIRQIDLSYNQIRTVRASDLPASVEQLCLSKNSLTGTLDLSGTRLKRLELHFNPELTELTAPRTLELLQAGYCALEKLSGELPELETLRLMGNRFREMPKLYGKLKELTINENQLSTLTASDLPSSLEQLNLSGNAFTELEDLSGTRLRSLNLSDNRQLRQLPTLPQTLRSLFVENCALESLPENLPGLQSLTVNSNGLRRLPRNLPTTLRNLIAHHNQVAQLPDDINRLVSCEIDLRSNPILPESIPNVPPGQPGPRFLFSMQEELEREEIISPTVAQAVRHWLGEDMGVAIDRWEAIGRTLEGGDEGAGATLQFRHFLDRLRGTVSYKNEEFRASIREWLVELSKPERKALLENSMQICVGATETCQDRVSMVLNELTKSRIHDDIRRGLYDGRTAKIIDTMRQMFRIDELEGLAWQKIKSMRRVDDVEVYMAFLVKLREPLALSAVVPEMRFFGASFVTQEELDAALTAVRETERTGFYRYLVLDDTWNSLVKRKLGASYEKAEARLHELAAEPLQQRIRAELQKEGLNPDDPTAQRNVSLRVWNQMRWEVLEPYTREFLTAEGVALPTQSAEATSAS